MQRLNEKWTEEDFKKYTGYEPDDDDMHRVNCDMAGEAGHVNCGICIHRMPVFMCNICFHESTIEFYNMENRKSYMFWIEEFLPDRSMLPSLYDLKHFPRLFISECIILLLYILFIFSILFFIYYLYSFF